MQPVDTASQDQAVPVRRRWRSELRSVRTRVVAVLLLLVTTGMIVAGALTYVLQRNSVDSGVQPVIEQEIAELQALARAPDPTTGDAFTSVEALFREYLRTNIPGPYENFGGLIDDGRMFVSSEQPLKLRELPGVNTIGSAAMGTDTITFQDIDSTVGTLRVTAIPVNVAADPADGVFLIAYEIGRARDSQLGWVRTYMVVTVITVVLAGAVGALVASRLLRPLRDLRSATEIISSTDLSRRVEVGADSAEEIGTLAQTFNSMLDRLQESFDAQRQFLDDAGHELRTPISIVRGHLEVMDAGDPVDVASTRDLLLDELDRMQRMVQDLALLSQARRPDFLRIERVELPRLIDETFERIRYLGPQQWRIDEQADGTVMADPQRLTQALVQLAANAAKYCPADATVAIGAAWAADHEYLRLWVRDTGPGIDPADQQRIFTRFARASTGRGVDGSGLGLSIVSAIADAHGGRVELVSTPGRGARFTVVIPPIANTSTDVDGMMNVDHTNSVEGTG